MCGIAGFATRERDAPVAADLVLRMARTLVHRGPDGEGVHVGPGVGLAVRRLAIVDVEHGEQPIANEDATVLVVCNGEIYDAPEQRARLTRAGHRFRSRSDAEVIVHVYEEHGLGFVRRLRGMFGLALWDAKQRRLVLARDRVGMKPLCWHESEAGLWFGSEAKAILAGCDPPRDLDPDAWSEALRAKLDETVRLHRRSDMPIGMLLSAGLDSSAVASLLCAQSEGRRVPSYSLGFDADAFDELRHETFLHDDPGFALEPHATTARAADLALLPWAVWCSEEPNAGGTDLWRMRLAALAARDVKVVLTGEGADEALGGYRWYHGQKVATALLRLPGAVRRLLLLDPLLSRFAPGFARLLRAAPEMTFDGYRSVITARTWRDGARLLAPDLARAIDARPEPARPAPPEGFAAWHPFDRLQYFDLTVRLVDLVNATLDRATMAWSLEARLPFLDHEVLELCLSIPPGLRMRGLREKWVLRRAMRGRLPRAIRERAKRGTRCPIGVWLRAPLPEPLEHALQPARLAETGIFDPQVVHGLLAEHRAGAADHGATLWAVLAVQLWHEAFVERRSPPSRPAIDL